MSQPDSPPSPVRPLLDLATPRRGKPPRHFADLSMTERRAAMADVGLPAYRAKQLSTQYFGRLETDVAAMTDVPAKVRDSLASDLFPDLLHPVRTLAADA